MGSSLLTDADAVNSNRMGEISHEQASALKSKLGSLSGWFTLAIMAALLALAVYFAGDVLSQSTVLGAGALVGIIIVAFIITSSLGGVVAERRMEGMTVEPEPGEVVWDNRAYVARATGRVLEPITGGLDLQPGGYTFYIVHGTKWLLSAEPAEAPHHVDIPTDVAGIKAMLEKSLDFDPAQSPEKMAAQIAEAHRIAASMTGIDPSRFSESDKEALRQSARKLAQQLSAAALKPGGLHNLANAVQAFEQASLPPLDSTGLAELNRALEDVGTAKPADLATNQQGQLAGDQRGALMSDLRSNLTVAAVLFAGAAAAAYFGRAKLNLIGILAVGGFFGLIEVFLLSQVSSDLSDALGGRVQMSEGAVTKYTRTTHSRTSRTHYYFRLGDARFEVSRQAYDALLPGRNYRLYYAPKTHRLVNIEPLA